MEDSSPHRVETVLFLRRQLSEKDVELMQVRHDHLKIIAESRAAKAQWEEVLEKKNSMIVDGAERIRRFTPPPTPTSTESAATTLSSQLSKMCFARRKSPRPLLFRQYGARPGSQKSATS